MPILYTSFFFFTVFKNSPAGSFGSVSLYSIYLIVAQKHLDESQ